MPSDARAVPKPLPALREPKTLRQKLRPIPADVKRAVFARDDLTCRWCRVPGGALDAHHIQRRSQGGRDVAYNLVSVHRSCHRYVHEHPAEAKAAGFLA